MRKILIYLFVFIALSAAIGTTASAQIEGLRSRVPMDTNAVVIIDAEKLFGSKAAEKGRWEARRNAAFEAGLTYLSPETTGVVIAANFDLEFGKTVWQLSQVRLGTPTELTTVAARFGGEMDSIKGRRATRLPNDSIIVQLTEQNLAAYTPANRQDVSRWLALTDATSVTDQLSPYISQAFSYVEKGGTPVIMALDVEGVLSADDVARKMKSSPVSEKLGEKLPQAIEVLASMKGAMLGVTVGEKPFGSIRVDFDKDASVLKEVGKEILINVLERQGAMIDDIRDWELSVKDNTLVVSGTLSESGLKLALSVLELPASLGSALDMAQSTGAATDPETLTKLASQQYYKSIQSVLHDLRHKNDDKRTVTAGSVALWYDKYARKIDNLPILNVDEDLLAYGRDVAELLRQSEMALKGVGMRTSLRQGVNDPTADGYSTYYGSDSGYYNTGYGGYGGYRSGYAVGYVDPYGNAREKGRTDSVIRSQEATRGAATVNGIWQTIENASADIRRIMTKKYNIEF